MSRRTLFRAFLILATLISLVSQAIALPRGQHLASVHAAGNIQVFPNQGPPSTQVRIIIDAGTFKSPSMVTASFTDSAGAITNAFAAATNVASDGSVTISATIPSNARAGYGTIKVTGTAPNGTEITLAVNFLAQATLSIYPDSGAAGSTVTITANGSGFTPGSTITFTANGVNLLTSSVVTTNGTGGFVSAGFSLQLPQQAGTLTIAATDGSNTRASQPFTVNAAPSATPTVTGTPVSGGLSVAPNSGPPGQSVVLTAPAGSFGSGAAVSLLLTDRNSNATQLPAAVAALNGSLSDQITIPAAAAGTAQIVASALGTVVLTGQYTIQPTIAITPTTAAPGSLIQLQGSGFSPGRRVSLTLGGVTLPTSTTPTTDATGSFSLSFLVPATLPSGSLVLGASDGTNVDYAQTTLAVIAPTATPTSTATASITPLPSATATTIVTTAYFAEGYTGQATTNGKATFTEVLDVLNPSASAAAVTFTYYPEGGSPIVVTRSVAPTSVLQELVNGDVGNDQAVGTVVTSSQHVIVRRTISRIAAGGNRLDGSTTLPASAPATSWGFPEGYTGITFQEYLTLLNPSNNVATVTIVLAPQSDSAAGARTLTIQVPAQGRKTANIRALNRGTTAQSVGMLVSSNVPVVAERVEYFGDGSGSGKFGSTVSSGSTTPSTQVRFAYGSSGGTVQTAKGSQPSGDQEYLTLLNPSTSGNPVQATITFADTNGGNLGQPVTVAVAPGTRKTIIGNLALSASGAGPVSASLSANGPIYAESAQYFGGSPNTGNHPGVAFPGLAGASTDTFLASLSTILTDGTRLKRMVYLYNPNPSTIQVTGIYYSSGGAPTHVSYAVPAGGITKVNVNTDSQSTFIPGPVGAEFTSGSGGGSFIAEAIGISNDGLTAMEDVGSS